MFKSRPFLAWVAVACLQPGVASAVVIDQLDTFEDGTTANWVVSLLGMPSPVPPVNVASGGPGGVDDNFLQLESIGGAAAGSRLAVINLAQWAGDYSGAGITHIEAQVRNLGNTDIFLRLFFENPQGGPPTDTAITDAFLLPAGSDWISVSFAVLASDLTLLTGDIDTLMSNVTALRFYHSEFEFFPGPPVVSMLGIDNIRAVGVRQVPAPGGFEMLLLGLFGLIAVRRFWNDR